MKKIIFVILLTAILAGCKEDNPTPQTYVVRRCAEACNLQEHIDDLRLEVIKLRKYAECPEHKFLFQRVNISKLSGANKFCSCYIFVCNNCNLKLTLEWDDLTMHQKNCYTGLIGLWDPNEVKE